MHVPTFQYLLFGIVIGLLWTALGLMISLLSHSAARFWREWYRLQGFPLVALGTCLVLVIYSDSLTRRVAALTSDGSIPIPAVHTRGARATIVLIITAVGTASLVSLGFNAIDSALLFMWGTAAVVCLCAALVTLHAIDIVSIIRQLEGMAIHVFRYAPAKTKELRELVNYFTTFTLLMTIGYGFSLLGTLKGGWRGNSEYVKAVQLFWPVLYVPLCSIALIYPHVIVHRLIRREKDRTLALYQRDIDESLNRYPELKPDDVQRVNTLVQLFDRISSTPDYVMDLSIAVRTCLPLAFNFLTLIAKTTLKANG